MNLGFSHPIEYMIPDGISISVEKNTKLIVQGISKEAVGQTAAVLRGYRPPDSYRGKGVRYEGEHIKLKAGKSAKS
jgi:large subunit ribosomal protein L6